MGKFSLDQASFGTIEALIMPFVGEILVLRQTSETRHQRAQFCHEPLLRHLSQHNSSNYDYPHYRNEPHRHVLPQRQVAGNIIFLPDLLRKRPHLQPVRMKEQLQTEVPELPKLTSPSAMSLWLLPPENVGCRYLCPLHNMLCPTAL